MVKQTKTLAPTGEGISRQSLVPSPTAGIVRKSRNISLSRYVGQSILTTCIRSLSAWKGSAGACERFTVAAIARQQVKLLFM